MLKKVLSVVLSLALLLSVMPMSALSVAADGNVAVQGVVNGPTFVADQTMAMRGDTVTVALRVENNPGIVSLKLLVEYDATVLQLKSVAQADFKGGVFGNGPLTNNPIVVNWADTLNGNNTTNGVFAYLTFEVLGDAPLGDSAITLSYDPEDVYDDNFDNVTFDIANGVVNVFEYTSIAVTTLPNKTEYLEAKDTLDLNGAKGTLYYSNGSSAEFDLTADMISGFDNTQVGAQTLTVSYKGFTDMFEVEILAKSPVSVKLTTYPETLQYLEAFDALDVTGGKVTVYYDNDTSEERDLTMDMVSGFDNTNVGKQALTVTCEGLTDTFDVDILAKTPVRVMLTALPNTLNYLEAFDALDVSGGKVTVYYNNHTSEERDLTVNMVSGFDNTKVGKQTLTVTCEGFTDTFDVQIDAKTLESIAIAKKPTVTTYSQCRDVLNVAGGVVTLYYNNRTTETISLTAAMVSGFDNTVAGKQTLTVTYDGFTDTYDVDVIARELSSIAVSVKPHKTQYLEAYDELDVENGKVTWLYDNGTTEVFDLSADMISGFDNTIIGKQTLTVTCEGFTDTFEVEIIAKSLESIAVTEKPHKLGYVQSTEALSVVGGKVTLYYNNKTSDVIALTADMVSGFDNTIVGKQTLTVTYEEFLTTYDVTVVNKTAPMIAVDHTTARAGSTFTVAVRVKNNPGVVSFRVNVGYDSDVLELQSVTQADFVGGTFGVGPIENNPITITWVDTLNPNNTTNGALAYLTFVVKEDVAVCDTIVSVTYGADDVYNQDYENVEFATVEGVVSVVEYISGDVNDDKKVNNKDLGLLLQYLNGWDVPVVPEACDVTRDGKVNNKDLGILLQYLNGWDVELK